MTEYPITEPGIYDVPNEVYHSQEVCDGPSVSASGLVAVENESPLHFWNGWSGNPDAVRDATPALSFGTAVHMHLLEPALFEARVAVRPFPDYRTKAAKAWRADMEAAGRLVITQEDYARILTMVEVLHAHPNVHPGLWSREVERTLIWRDDKTGLWCKARPDAMPTARVMIDYKTTHSTAPVDLHRAIAAYGYAQKLAWIIEGLNALGRPIPEHAGFVFQEKTPPYDVAVVGVDALRLDTGRRQNRRALDVIARCLKTDEWPGRTWGADISYQPPGWVDDRLAYESAEGLLPEVPPLGGNSAEARHGR